VAVRREAWVGRRSHDRQAGKELDFGIPGALSPLMFPFADGHETVDA
jgi:hypothetical protein